MWRKIWVPNNDLRVVSGNLSDDFKITTHKSRQAIYCGKPDGEYSFANEYKKASNPATGERYHYCPACELWVEGDPFQEHENTMGVLCGRDGVVTRCRCCGIEFDFNGAIA